MNFRRLLPLSVIAASTLILTSCGGGSSTPPPPTVTVSLSGQPASLSTSATASITATVSNSTNVTWSVTCATASCGSFNPTSTSSGAATVYTAPSTPTSVTVTATSSSGPSASATITVAAPAIAVTFNPAAPGSLSAGSTGSLTAVVTNDSANAGVNWTVTCSNSPCGSFSPTKTASGTATTYTAPAAIPTSGTVTVTATSVTDTTRSATATITITAPGISVALNPTPPTSLALGATTSLTAVVSNDSQSKGVTWTATCGSSSCGSFNPASTASGTATVYTAPTAVPSPNTVKLTATSVTDGTKSASATITVSQVLADGTYVYHFSGWDSTGPSFFAGAFTVAGGVITGGEQDFSDASIGYALNPLAPANCSLSVTGNNIQIVLALQNNTALGVNGIETIRGTVVSSSRVLISEFDTFGAATGSIDLQTTPVAAPSGGYAFTVSGWDINGSTNPATVNPLVIGGVLNFTGTSLSIGNSVFDYNRGGTIGQALLFASGSVNGPDSFGRISISLVPTSTSGVPSFIFTGYVLSPNQIQLVESQADTLSDDLGGMALGQGANAGKFSVTSLANTTYVFASSGEDINNLATFGGSLSFGSSGAITGTLAINDLVAANAGATSITGGNYTVDPTGRATLSGVLTSKFPSDPFAFQLYLDGNGNALQLGIDTIEITSGPAYLKTATSNDFEGPYALAGGGILNDTNLDAWGAVGPVTVAADNLTGTTDYGAQGLTPTPAQAVTATENNSAGTLSVVGLDSSSFTTSRLYSYFPIDSKRVLAIETDGTQLGILTLESTSH